jgi:PBSX family phage portal protein
MADHLIGSELQNITNRFGKTLYLKRLPAIAMRKSVEPGKYIKLNADGEIIRFKKDEVIHIQEPDIKQDIYGLPEYLGGLQSVLLSEDSTLFRRRFYVNGAHMGYILVTSNAGISPTDAKAIEQEIKRGKGAGNGRSLYLNIPKTIAKEPVQVLPIGELGTKDDFEKIQHATMREMIAMHRMQPGLAGLIPDNVGGFGDPKKIMEVYHDIEVIPMQQPFLELNEYLTSAQHISFKEPKWGNETNT